MPRHLFLIGLPGAGKTATRRLVAARLDTHGTDIDPIIEHATGMSRRAVRSGDLGDPPRRSAPPGLIAA